VITRQRLPESVGGLLVERDKRVEFSFEGRRFEGLAGDCIASALAANGVWLLSRSFKYHRPRGVLSMAGQDANSLVQLPSDPNVLADRAALREGLRVAGQNYRGSLDRDRGAWIQRWSRFLPVGFYYKAFFKPRGVWEKWAPMIRRMAGLGVVDTTLDPGYFDKQYKFCDVVVIGGGPAGMQAAIEAARAGASVTLIEEQPVLGGALCYARFDAAGTRARELRAELLAAVEGDARIEVMSGAVCNGWFADNWLPIIGGRRLYKLRAREVIVCAGALEQQAVFHDNDLPGVMLGSAAQRLIRLYAVRPGRTAVVLTANEHGYGVALDLADAGVTVAAVVDLRANAAQGELGRAVVERGIRVLGGHAVYAAIPSAGGRHVAAADVRAIVARGECAPDGERIACDLLCMSPGYTPTYQIPCQAGATLGYDDNRALFHIDGLPQHLRIAGSVNGAWTLDAVRDQARRAAAEAVTALGLAGAEFSQALPADAASPNFDWPIFAHPEGKEFVDYDEDLQLGDIVNATRDGYEHIQLVKRYSTVGMGPSQGRHSALATARLVAAATGTTVARTGVSTARPPFAPERLGHLAGRAFYPERHSSMHHRHLESGAQMLLAGAWMRPAYYGAPGERETCMRAEALNVRNNVGLVDVSTLGGIEVRGPDAGEFLNRLYTYGFVKQAVGHARYALMTNEQGVIIDDGVACRLHQQHYYVTATTGGVDRVYQGMLQWNAQWRLDIDIANVTASWCGVNIAGPRAREVLAEVCTDVDLSAAAFPYMGVRIGTVAGIPARLIRVGFVGELGYEVHVPQHCGEALWDAMLAAGAEAGIRPFGIEAQRLLRLEKGHIIIGQDSDAMTHPVEVGMEWAIARRKPFFVGCRSIEELGKRPLKRKLAGFVVNDPGAPIPLESHLVMRDARMVGRVTSCLHSPTLEKPVGLAYVTPDQAAPGQRITIRSSGGVLVNAEIVALPFYDPGNKRQEM